MQRIAGRQKAIGWGPTFSLQHQPWRWTLAINQNEDDDDRMMIGWWWSSSSSKDIIWNKLLFPCNTKHGPTPSIGYHCEERMIMGMIMLATMIMLTSLTIMHGDQKVEHFSPATPSMDWISMDPPYLSVWGTKMRMQHQPIPPINPIIIRIRMMIGAGGILGF